MKYLLSFMLFIIPFVVTVVCLRSITTGSLTMPNSEEIIGMFSAIGQNSDLMKAIDTYNDLKLEFKAITVSDWDTFWQLIGTELQQIGAGFNLIMQVIFVPFRCLAWLFGLVAS